MPLTAKGEEILAKFREEYGDKAEEMFYAAKNAGTISGVDSDKKLSERLDSLAQQVNGLGEKAKEVLEKVK